MQESQLVLVEKSLSRMSENNKQECHLITSIRIMCSKDMDSTTNILALSHPDRSCEEMMATLVLAFAAILREYERLV